MERSSADTRTKILEVAEEYFAREGYAGAHLQGIAERVGVQKTALYYYFDSKAALYTAILTRMLEDFDRTVGEALDPPGEPAERLRRLLDGMNDLLSEKRTYSQILIRIFVDRAQLSPENALRPLIERVIGRVLRFHREGTDAGVFVKRSGRHFVQTLLGATAFHYASTGFGAAVLDVEDIFTQSAISWRRKELSGFVLRAVLVDPDASD
ncbi:MAG: TetR/AcrR family transcriptional regulator [Myxococcota bacterium]|nr:TetR/AcrR family transcriptional regulator [Myxococcota bacterium]